MMRKAILLMIAAVLTTAQLLAQTNTGNIEGHVLTSDGKPVEEANVQIRELNKFTRTGKDGVFRFRNIPFGSYTLVYSYAGAGGQQIQVTVPPEVETSTNYKLALDNKQLAEVTVSTRKGINNGPSNIGKANIPVMDLPQSIVTIGESMIEIQQAQRLGDVVKNANGVYVGGMRAGTQETIYARGYNFSNTNMFKNGFRVNTGAMPEMSGLESVELLKGSAAILYGNVAPGGILNMVTKKPKFDFGGSVNMRVGSFGLLKPSVDFYGPLSGAAAFRVNSTYETAKSFRDEVESKRFYINPSLLFKLGKRTELLVQGDYLKHNFTPDFGIGSVGGTKIADVPRSRFMGAPWQYTKTRQATASTELNHKLKENWQLNIGLAYQNYHRDYFSLERIQADATGKWTRPKGRFDNKENYYTGQANLTGKFNTGKILHNVLAGMDADRILADNLTSDSTGKAYDVINILDPTQYVRRADIPGAPWTARTTQPVSRFGVYLQDLISLSEKLKVLAGIRWSYQYAESKTDSILKNIMKSTTPRTDKAFSPRLGIVYQPAKTTSLFASYANSFTPNSGEDVHGAPIPASIIDQFELGIKNTLLDGKLNANLTLYRIINNNLAQMAPFKADGTTPNTNSNIKELTGQTTADGVELDIKAMLVKGLDVIAGYSYNHSRYTKNTTGSTAFVNGQKLVNTPAHTANATAFYRFDTGALNGFKLGVGVYYIGERIAGWNYTYGNERPLFPVKAFTTIDLSAGYDYKKISVIAKLANITNTYNYYVHENYSINPIPPRNFVVTVGYRF